MFGVDYFHVSYTAIYFVDEFLNWWCYSSGRENTFALESEIDKMISVWNNLSILSLLNTFTIKKNIYIYLSTFYFQALIHLLRSAGVDLNNKPIPPEDKRKKPKGYVAKKPEEDPDWIEYW